MWTAMVYGVKLSRVSRFPSSHLGFHLHFIYGAYAEPRSFDDELPLVPKCWPQRYLCAQATA